MIYIPENTFLHSYMEYMSEQETPRIFDLMCGCWCLSNALGRHTIVDRPRAPVHLNMYVILVSESGIMRKSTSIRIATSLVRKLFDSIKSKTVLIETKASMGMLINELSNSTRRHDQAHMVLIASELAASFGRAGGIGNVVALLTDLYDCPDVRTGALDVGNSVSINFKNVYSSFLAGSTPSWLEKAVTPTIIEGGFTSRCYFVVGKQRKRSIAWPNDEQQSQDKLLAQLGEIHEQSHNWPRIGISDGGRKTFIKWYDERILHRDTYRESFESREDSHILRFGGLFAANERQWIISDDHIRRAIDFVGQLKDTGTGLFTAQKVNATDVKWLNKVRDILVKAGSAGVSRMDMSRSVNPTGSRTNELRATLHTMHELDLIRVEESSYEGMRGRPKTTYYATEYLKNEAFLEDVVRKLGLEN